MCYWTKIKYVLCTRLRSVCKSDKEGATAMAATELPRQDTVHLLSMPELTQKKPTIDLSIFVFHHSLCLLRGAFEINL